MTDDSWEEEDQKYRAQVREEWEEKKRRTILGRIFPYYREKTLDDFEVETSDQADTLDAVRKYVEEMPEMRAIGKGITFVGQNGVGKTHLACAVMREAGIGCGYRIGCVELSTYINMYLRMFQLGKLEDDEVTDLIDRIAYLEGRTRLGVKGATFLLLDDVGREHESTSGWSNDRVFDLLRYRHNRNLPTIITTNAPLPKMEERYSEGLTSFLREATIIIHMEGEDYRWRGAS